MKIIELNFFLGGGGASRFMVDLSNQYARDCNNEVITVSVVNPETSGNDYISFEGDLDSRVRYVALNAKKGLCLQAFWGVFKMIFREHPDVVHVHSNVLLVLLPALVCSKVRFVHTIHTLVTRQYSGGFVKKVAYWLFKTGRIQPVTISKECSDSYKECFGSHEDVLIINGRDCLKTTDKLRSVGEELLSLGVKDEIPTFIHVARSHPVKNHNRLFSVFERLAEEGVDYQLIVIGDHYDNYVERLKNHKHIHLLGPRTNISDYMSYANYYVLSSDKEGLPLSMLEAMSMGVIPVCTPAGGVKDVIRNGENGFMGADVSDECFYNTVKQALKDGTKISRESIIKEYKDKYSIEICAQKYMSCYRNVL